MSQERLNFLAKLTIESHLASSLKYEDVIDDFLRIKSRKKSHVNWQTQKFNYEFKI